MAGVRNAEPDEMPRPWVIDRCKVCRVSREDVDRNMVIVSPQQIAHFSREYGMTECGKDATKDGWWWPL